MSISYKEKYFSNVEKLQSLETELEELKIKFDNKNIDLNSNLSKYINSVDELENIYSNNNEEIKKYNENVISKIKLLNKKIQKVETLTSKINNITNTLNGNDISIQKIKAENRNNLHEDEILKTKLIRIKKELDDLKKKYIYCKRHHKEREINGRRERIKLLQQKNMEMISRNESLEKQKEFVKVDKSRFVELNDAIMHKKEALANAGLENKHMRKLVKEINDTLKTKDDVISKLQVELRQKKNQMQVKGRIVTSFRIKSKEIENNIANIQKEIEETKASIVDAEEKAQDLKLKSTMESTHKFLTYVYININ